MMRCASNADTCSGQIRIVKGGRHTKSTTHLVVFSAAALPSLAEATDLRPEAVQGFDRYIRLSEHRMAGEAQRRLGNVRRRRRFTIRRSYTGPRL